MKKLYTFTLVLMLLAINVLANDDYSIINEFKNRKLIVALQVESQEYIDELTSAGKSSAVTEYKNNILENNTNLTKVFNEVWKETSFEFLPITELESYTEEQLSKVVVLTGERMMVEKINFFKYNVSVGHFVEGKKKKITYKSDNNYFKIALENEVPSVADFTLLLKKIKIYFRLEKQFDRNGLESILAKKKLCIDKKAGLTRDDVSSAYPFSFEFKTAEEILQLKNDKDAACVYLKLDVAADNQINFMMVEAKTGLILARCHLTGLTKVSFNTPSGQHNKKYGSNTNCTICNTCLYCDQTGEEMFRLYTAKAKLKPTQLKYMSSNKKQLKYFPNLMIY
ncbi:MAG: hypothetical protein H6587_01455 [Flavobacteriales bacterium]|nr:hypothetical protein [Flavobacteriales bacterium]MCB9363211.1 hypothetical protein [Flavobacteriales bacterium]